MKILVLLITALLTVNVTLAQETQATEWTTESRCVTEPSEPPEGWTYDGAIFTFRYRDGAHARRADVATSYYVAFDDDTKFAVSASLSPDGRWLAVPYGYTRDSRKANSKQYVVSEILVYSTNPAHEQFQIPFYTSGEGRSSASAVASPVWLDNQRFMAFGSLSPTSSETLGAHIFNPFDQSAEALALPERSKLVGVSPDGTRWIYAQANGSGGLEARIAAYGESESSIAIPMVTASTGANIAPLVQWAADSSRFATLLSDGSGIGIFDRDGNLLDSMLSGDSTRFSLSRTGDQLAYEARGGTIRIADLQARTIIDTCIAPDYTLEGGLAFSPDGQKLAYTMPHLGWVDILDLKAWQAYRIDLAAAEVIGWYPLE